MRRPIKYQVLKITVPAAGTYTINAEADKTYARISGIGANITDKAALKDAVFSKFDIDANEIYPDGYEIERITTGQDLSPNDRFDNDVDERADGSTIVINYTDAGNAVAYPYNLRIYLRLKNPMP